MTNRLKFILSTVALALTAGCQSSSERHASEPVAESDSHGVHVVDYVTSDPRLEPTLRVGGVLDVRTKDGGPVVLQSQIDAQRRAAEQQRRETDAKSVEPAAVIESK